VWVGLGGVVGSASTSSALCPREDGLSGESEVGNCVGGEVGLNRKGFSVPSTECPWDVSSAPCWCLWTVLTSLSVSSHRAHVLVLPTGKRLYPYCSVQTGHPPVP